MGVYGYVRVYTLTQARAGESLEAQQRQVPSLCGGGRQWRRRVPESP